MGNRGKHQRSHSLECIQAYMSHRALTRAKLAAWHLGDPQFPDPAPWLAKTDGWLRSAERHAAQALRLAGASS